MQLLLTIFVVLFQYCLCFHLNFPSAYRRIQVKHASEQSDVFGGVTLPSPIAESLRSLEITNPSPIQQASLGTLDSGASSILHAHTGSGKTLAYILPALKRIYDTSRTSFKSLIVVPTRELAIQIAADVVSLCGDSSMVHICLGGAVADIGAPIVIGTPFRLLEVLKGGLNRTQVNQAMINLQYLVIDEVDRLIPVPGRYVRMEERMKLLQRNNPCIELIRFIVKHKENQLMNINRLRLSYSWEQKLPLQVVAASATVGRALLRELNKLFYSYQLIPITKEGQEPELVPPGSRGKLVVIRPEGVVPFEVLRKSAKEKDEKSESKGDDDDDGEEEEDDEKEGEAGDEAKLSRSIGIPSSISHIALLKPPLDPNDHAVKHMDPNKLNIKHLELLKDYWVYQRTSMKRGLLFVPTVKDVPLAVHMFRKWRVYEAVDLQLALGLTRHPDASGDVKGESLGSSGTASTLDTSELIFRAARRGVGGGAGMQEDGRELFIVPESAARGLNVQDLDCVMIFKLPANMDQYLHMAGRAGRLSRLRRSQDTAVNKDSVVTIVDDTELRKLSAWQTPLGIKLEPIGAENTRLHINKERGGRLINSQERRERVHINKGGGGGVHNRRTKRSPR